MGLGNELAQQVSLGLVPGPGKIVTISANRPHKPRGGRQLMRTVVRTQGSSVPSGALALPPRPVPTWGLRAQRAGFITP